jgi:chromosome segregation ATPase
VIIIAMSKKEEVIKLLTGKFIERPRSIVQQEVDIVNEKGMLDESKLRNALKDVLKQFNMSLGQVCANVAPQAPPPPAVVAINPSNRPVGLRAEIGTAIQRISKDLNEEKNINKRLDQELKEAYQKIAELTSNYTSQLKTDEVKTLTQQLKDLQLTVSSKEKELEIEKRRSTQLEEQVLQLKDAYNEANDPNMALLTSKASSVSLKEDSNRISELERLVQEKEKTINNLKRDLDAGAFLNKDLYENSIRQLKNELNLTKSECESIREQAKKPITSDTKKDETIASLQKDKEALEDQKNNMEKKLKDTEGEVFRARNETNSLQGKMNELQQSMSSLKEELTKKNEQITRLQQRKRETPTTIDADELTREVNENARLNKVIAQLQKEKQELSNKYKFLSDECDRDVLKLQKDYDSLKKKYETYQKNCRDTEKALNATNAALEQFQKNEKEWSDRVSKMKQKGKQLIAELKRNNPSFRLDDDPFGG